MSTRVSEPSVTASAIVGHTVGSHILRIDGYSHIKTLGDGKSFKSETFVVGGHRWWLQLYLGGVNSSYSDWISVFLHFDRNYNYANEVKAKIKIGLLDHDGNMVSSNSRTSSLRNFSCREGNWGFNEFIMRSDLEASVYLMNDVFSIRCDVTVTEKEILTKAIPVPAVRRSV